jgi:hypothetical protein
MGFRERRSVFEGEILRGYKLEKGIENLLDFKKTIKIKIKPTFAP